MKVNMSGNVALSTGIHARREIGFSQTPEAKRMLFRIVAEALYKDPITACLREYACNAYDANVEAGRADVPIEITLPTSLDPVFICRDFGLGMDPERVELIFVNIFESDKRESNELIGNMGIGSKCGYAYGPSFMVTSYVQGLKRVYNCFKDNGVPTMALMSEAPTDSPDGVEVRVPVKPHDAAEWLRKAERVYRYFKVRPKIRGAAQIEFENRDVTIKGSDWRICMDRSESVAIMGCIGYPIDPQAMGLMDMRLTTLLACGMEIDYDIGTLEIAPDREGLLYSEPTKKALLSKLRRCVDEVAAEATKAIANAETLWEAKEVYRSLYKQLGSSYHRVQSVLDNKVTWNGKSVTDPRHCVRNKEHDPKVRRVRYYMQTRYNGARYGKMQRNDDINCGGECDEVHVDKSWALIINDTKRAINNRRVRGFFEKPENVAVAYVMVFTFEDDAAQARYWKLRELEGAPTTLLSTCNPWVDPNNVANGTADGGGPSAHRSKHSSKVLKWTGVKPPGYSPARSEWWRPTVVDLKTDKGLYVSIDKFFIGEQSYSPDSFSESISNWKKAGIVLGDIYGFKPTVVAQINSHWTNFKDHIKAQADARLDLQEYANWVAAFNHKLFLDPEYLPKITDPASPAFQYLTVYAAMKERKNAQLYYLIHKRQAWAPPAPTNLPAPSFDLDDLKEKARKAYPVLDYDYNVHHKYSSTGIDFAGAYLGYIKLIDNQQPTK